MLKMFSSIEEIMDWKTKQRNLEKPIKGIKKVEKSMKEQEKEYKR